MSEIDQAKIDAAAKAVVTGKTTAGAAVAAGQQAAEAIQRGGETAAQTAQAAAETAADAARTTSAQAGEMLSAGADNWTAQAGRMAEQSQQGMLAVADYGRTVAESVQAIAGEWAEFARSGAERNLERMNALFNARSPADLANAQRDLLWGGMQDLMATQERVRRISMRMVAPAADRLGAGAPETRLAA